MAEVTTDIYEAREEKTVIETVERKVYHLSLNEYEARVLKAVARKFIGTNEPATVMNDIAEKLHFEGVTALDNSELAGLKFR